VLKEAALTGEKSAEAEEIERQRAKKRGRRKRHYASMPKEVRRAKNTAEDKRKEAYGIHEYHEGRVPRRNASKPFLSTVDKTPRVERAAKTPEALAQEELVRRELARRSLVNFINRFHPTYKAGWVHQLVCAKLEKFARDIRLGKSPRLMIFMPPRTGKSEIASKMFPAWFLGHYPEYEVIACSYAVALPLDFSRAIMEILRNEKYQVVFEETRLSRTSQSAETWRTTKRGGYVAAGVSGPITGKGAHCLIIDDPVKDAEEADSEAVSEKTWNWYGSTARTRLAPGGGILVIQTRWNEKDLSGRLQLLDVGQRKAIIDEAERARESGAPQERIDEILEKVHTLENWDIVSFPAIAEHDEYLTPEGQLVYEVDPAYRLLRKKSEALHPARFDRNALMQIKGSMQPRHWQSLYQQNPTPDDGSFITKDMLRYEPGIPDYREMHVYAAWDLAIGQKQRNDWTVGIVGAWDWNGDLHLIDMIRGRMNTHEIALAIVEVALKYRCAMTGIEKGQLELAVRPEIERVLREKKKSITLAEGPDALKPVTDKMTRARPLQGMMQRGRIYLPADQPWVDTLVPELLRFPNGLNDDIVDAMAWMARMTINAGVPVPPSERFKPKVQSWKDKLRGTQQRKHFMAA